MCPGHKISYCAIVLALVSESHRAETLAV